MDWKRAISQKQGEEWSRSNGDMPHYVVSAKDGSNVAQAFTILVKEALARADAGPDVDLGNLGGIDLHRREEPSQGGAICCNYWNHKSKKEIERKEMERPSASEDEKQMDINGY